MASTEWPKPTNSDDERQVADPAAIQPSQRLPVERNNARSEWTGRKLNRDLQNGDRAPDDQNHDHDRGDHHDLHGLLAGLVNALDILPPEVNRDDCAEAGGECVFGKVQRMDGPR